MGHRIAVIGGGLSGVLSCIALIREVKTVEVILLEKNPEYLGRGIAYHSDFTHQPLNVPAAGMSLYPDDPDHFLRWLQENKFRYHHLIDDPTPKSFVSRKVFGDYVSEQLQTAHQQGAGRFQIRIDEVLDINQHSKGYDLFLESGVVVNADTVLLALGNFPPADIFSDDMPVRKDKRYFSNPWTDRIYSGIKGDEHILLAGTGLTAVDVVLGLHMRGFRGQITLFSRRGRLPMAHDLSHAPVVMEYPGDLSPQEWLIRIRNIIRMHADHPWIAVIEGLRPHAQRIWMSWNQHQRAYFLKKLRPFWEIARHRIPASSMQLLEQLKNDQKLIIQKASLKDAEIVAQGIRVTLQTDTGMLQHTYQKVINCTGPESNIRKINSVLLRSLFERGIMQSDVHRLGIQCTPDGKVINRSGKSQAGLYCIGPMRKAVLWETTALREIREQAFVFAHDQRSQALSS